METTLIAGKSVSRIGLGTWAIGGLDWGFIPDEQAIRICLTALEHGINLIDTAPIYGHGRAEEIVGRAIREHGKREAFFIATKVGLDWGQPDGCYADSTEKRIRFELEASLRRLGTDHIDLYQVHWPDTVEPIERTAELLAGFVREGKVRALGVSNFNVPQMEEFRKVAPLASNQPPYNLFERQIDEEILPWCHENKIAVLTWSSLCRSLLGGRVRRGSIFEKSDIRSVDPKFQEPRLSQYMTAVERLEALAHERFGKSVVELAARWVLDRPGISVALWGTRKPEQLATIDGLFGWKIDPETMREIDLILAESVTDPVGPEYLAPKARHIE